MDEVKKIVVQKSDEPASVAEKLMDTDASAVIVSIPKFSKFGESASNFKLIKREADLLKKTVTIESVDEDVVALAKKSGLAASNPFFGRAAAARGAKKFSDIVVKKKSEEPAQSVSLKRSSVRSEPVPEAPTPEPIASMPSVPIPEPVAEAPHEELPSGPRITGIVSLGELPKQKRLWGQIFRRRTAVLVVLAVLIFGILPYVALAVLPQASVTITMRKEPWTFADAVVADKNITASDIEHGRIPGQVFMQKSNASTKFPATGAKNIQRKATGSITIYNAYNSSPQSLVVNTRFQAPDGKIFRLTAGVIVPGAKIEDGKVVPAGVTAEVVADKPGEAYNIGPISRLTIPGFSGTPKYDSFYGEAKTAMSGGYIGEAKVATEADMKAAKEKATESLEASLRTLLLAQMPGDFKVLDAASSFTLLKQTVTPEADADGQFTVFSEGQVAVVAFREVDLLDFFHQRIATEKGDYKVVSETNAYGAARVDLAAGRMSFAVDYTAQLARSVNEAELLSQIKGKPERELSSVINGIAGVESGKVSLWPFYVRTVPKNTDRIELTVQ